MQAQQPPHPYIEEVEDLLCTCHGKHLLDCEHWHPVWGKDHVFDRNCEHQSGEAHLYVYRKEGGILEWHIDGWNGDGKHFDDSGTASNWEQLFAEAHDAVDSGLRSLEFPPW